jgi:hypothetical protein
LVGTRTGPQIRSHAQKHFNKIKKDSGLSDVSDCTPKNADGSLSLWMCDPNLKKSRSTLVTNKRKLKEENKHKETRSSNSNFNMPKNVENYSEYSENLTMPQLKNMGYSSLPLTPQRIQNIQSPKDFNMINDTNETQENKKVHNEEEVLMLIKFIIKEFANILGKYCDSQQTSMLPNLGGLNVNSSLLLSLLMAEQNKMKTTSPIANFMQPNSFVDNMFSTQYNQGFNLNSLLRNQPMKQNDNNSNTENLLQIPKMSS